MLIITVSRGVTYVPEIPSSTKKLSAVIKLVLS
jgi:hypothetical protein